MPPSRLWTLAVHGRLRPLQWLVLAAILLLTAFIAVTSWRVQSEDETGRRADWAARAADELHDEYGDAVDDVRGLRAFFDSSVRVERGEFDRFARLRQRHSDLLWFAWSPRVRAGDRARFERESSTRIIEVGPAGPVPARPRPEHFPLWYVAPRVAGVGTPLGLDLGVSDPEIAGARDTGRPVASRPFSLPASSGASMTGAITLPIYRRGAPLETVALRRAALTGFVGGTFRYADLAARLHKMLPAGSRFALEDDGTLVVGPAGSLDGEVQQGLSIDGRRWTLRVAVAGGGAGVGIPAAIGGVGGALCLLTALLFAQANRRRHEREAAQARLRGLVRSSADMIDVIDPEGRIVYQSPAVRSVLGYPPETLLGSSLRELLHADDAHAVLTALGEPPRLGATSRVECRWATADGRWISAETTMTDLRDDPAVRGWVLNTRDMSERVELEAELARQAFHDHLTGLANRALFTDRAVHALERRSSELAVLFCDLDDFKRVNDTRGHHFGDGLLSEIAVRLRGCVRAGDTVARLGGDEFALLLEDQASVDEADEIAARVIEVVGRPLSFGGDSLEVRCSVGVATTADAATAEELLRNADVAMYAAKAAGKGGVARYEPAMHAILLDRVALGEDLTRALERGEFRVHYQPLVELEGGRVVGVEALARWDHPRRGLMAPLQFIPLAEETGQIVELGEIVLREACRQARSWEEEHPELSGLTVNVNLSARQLVDPRLHERVTRALRESGLPPERLVLEITESVLMSDTEISVRALTGLKALGVRLAIDDFGTGYSSLAYLERLPVDQIKVDRCFVESIDRGDGKAPLVRAILELGRVMGLEVTAEGVERPEQARMLREAGVDLAQGFYFSRPATAGQVAAHLTGGPLPRRAGGTALRYASALVAEAEVAAAREPAPGGRES